MSPKRTYLDYNATAPLRPEASAALVDALGRCGNASSVHSEGRAARASIEAARGEVAGLVNAEPAQVIFTGGGTEANNLAIRGVIGAEGVSRILVSGIEHPSVLETAAGAGVSMRRIAVTPDGLADLADLQRALSDDDGRALVCVMLANNETGAIQPVMEIARLAHEHGALMHTDAVQAAGKVETDFRVLGVDMMALSGHKIGGPQGVGALIVRDGIKLDPQALGGGQELKRRAGTENVPAIAGFGAAARCAADGLAGTAAIAELRDHMERTIVNRLPDAVVLCAGTSRLPNTTCLAVPGVSAEYLVIALDLAGFAVSSGSACSSGKVARSHVLEAMGLDGDIGDCAVRVSLGWANEPGEIDRFSGALVEICERKLTAANAA